MAAVGGPSWIRRLGKLLINLRIRLVSRNLLVFSAIILKSDLLARRSKCMFGKIVFWYFLSFSLAKFWKFNRR
jgi:hypothetical protein